MTEVRPLLACEELFLLLTRDDGTKDGRGLQRGLGLAAALLADLEDRGCVGVEELSWGRRVLRVRPSDPLGDDLLDAARARLAGRDGKSVTSLVQDKNLAPEYVIGTRLVRAEIVGHEPPRRLGLVAQRWPVLDPAPEAAIRARLLQAVLDDGRASARDVTLLGVLHALGRSRPLLGEAGLGRSEFGRRTKRFGETSPWARALKKVLEEQASAGAGAGAGA